VELADTVQQARRLTRGLAVEAVVAEETLIQTAVTPVQLLELVLVDK
jgi:hypothetical protein